MNVQTMRAVTLPDYQGNIIRALRSLEIKETNTPELLPDEVLVEVAAAPANPSDLAFIQGGYNVKKAVPAVPGFEGAGKVIKTGNSEEAGKLMDKQVSFFSQSDRGGSWASHTPVKAKDCIVLEDGFPTAQAACFSVNPFTAYAMIELAAAEGARAIIQNAASGQVGKFINKLAMRAGIQLINIVRKEEKLQKMSEEGVQNVLCTQDEEFLPRLKQLANKLDARIAFDAAGGEQSGHLLASMPENSTLYLYGALAGRTLSEIPATDIIFKRKSLRGFNMNEWKANLDEAGFLRISNEMQQLFISGELKTDIQAEFPLEDYEKALMQYIRAMSEGKVLLKP